MTVTVSALGAQASRLEAESAVMVTVAATGAVTTSPLGWGAVTVTYRGGGSMSVSDLCVRARWLTGPVKG